MTKNNKLLLGILAFIVTLTVGYAVFTQSVTVSGTATANGKFELTTTCQTGAPQAILTAYDITDADLGNGYSNDSCVASNNMATINVQLNYPTAERSFTVKIKNTGTIKASLSLRNFERANRGKLCRYNSSDNSLVDECVDLSSSEVTQLTDEEYNLIKRIWNYYIQYVIIGFESSNGSFISAEDDLFMNMYLEEEEKIVLAPNESIYIMFTVHWDDVNSDEKLRLGQEYMKYYINYGFPFEQVND